MISNGLLVCGESLQVDESFDNIVTFIGSVVCLKLGRIDYGDERRIDEFLQRAKRSKEGDDQLLTHVGLHLQSLHYIVL